MDTVDAAIPVDAGATKRLEDPAPRATFGRYRSALFKGGRIADALAAAIADARRDARASGLTDEAALGASSSH